MRKTYERPVLDVELLDEDIICDSDETTVQSDDPGDADNAGSNYTNFDKLNFTF